MYLSRIFLNTDKRDTVRALSNPSILHGAVEQSFSGGRQSPLWRLDELNGKPCLLVLSIDKPEYTAIVGQFGFEGDEWETKSYSPVLEKATVGSKWNFRLTANPTYSKSDGSDKRGTVCAHRTPAHQKQWLIEQSAKRGFKVTEESFDVTRSKWIQFIKHSDGNRKVTFLSVTFEGILEVTDKELFAEILCAGIGRAKSYGQGLLTVVRPHV